MSEARLARLNSQRFFSFQDQTSMRLVPSQSSSPRDREGTASLWERPLKAGMLAVTFGHWAEVSSPSSGASAAQDTAWTFETGVFFLGCCYLFFCFVLPKSLFTQVPIQSRLRISSRHAGYEKSSRGLCVSNSVTRAFLPNLI